MKQVFAAAIFLAVSMFGSSQAYAWLPVEVQAFWTPQEVTFQVENVFAAPIYCTGQFLAQTVSLPAGEWTDFAIGPVLPGTWDYAYMTPPLAYSGDVFTSIPQTIAYCNYY